MQPLRTQRSGHIVMVEKPETVVSNMCRELQTKTSHFNFPAVGLI